MLSLLRLSTLFFVANLASSVPLEALEGILRSGIENRVYPGAAAVVGNLDGIIYQSAVGRHSYDERDTATKMETIFDLASLTKVVSTTSVVALLYQNGYINLNTYIYEYLGEDFKSGGKENITVLNCLLHNAGFAPDPVPWYWDPAFACPNTADPSPAEDFSCLNTLIYNSVLNETVVTSPGETYTYSDLSFITLQLVVGTVVLEQQLVRPAEMDRCLSLSSPLSSATASSSSSSSSSNNSSSSAPYPQQVVCAFEAFVRTNVFHRPTSTSTSISRTKCTGTNSNANNNNDNNNNNNNNKSHANSNVESDWMPMTNYLPSENLWPACMPTLNDTGAGSYTHKRLQGQVADGDCYAMGGIAGHAGVFSTAPDLAVLARYLLAQAVAARQEAGVSAATTTTTTTSTTTTTTTTTAAAAMSSSKELLLPFLNASTVRTFTTVHNTSQSSRALGWSTNTPLVCEHHSNTNKALAV
jgi:CubicO group peptidase (beta-lactamase class C family)